jgi:V/A-type H+-transporting ATPase subunit C
MSSVLKYAYVSAKVRGMKLLLLNKERFYSLLGSRDLEGLLRLLEDTPYELEAYRIMEKPTPANIETTLMENFVKTVETIIDESPSILKDFLRRNLRKLEASNLKLVLRAKHSGLKFTDIQDQLFPLKTFEVETCKALLEGAKTVKDIVYSLEGSPYIDSLKSALPEYESKNSLLPLETALDKYIYLTLIDGLREFGSLDRKVAQELIGVEVDTLNVKVAIRCKKLNVEQEVFQNYIIPSGYVFDEERLLKAYTVSGVEELFQALAVHHYTPYIMRGFEDYKNTKSLMGLEVELDRLLMKINKEICRKYPSPFHVGVVLSYVNLKWFEIRNLRTIMLGKVSGIPSEAIAKLLIL